MNKNSYKLIIVFILVAFITGCTSASPTPAAPAYWPTDGWQTTSPEGQGMDSDLLAQMVEHIKQEKLDIHSLLIVRNGYLVNELYVYPYTAEQPHTVFSVTKSVISALVGIAIRKGYIKDVNQTLLSLLPDQPAANLDEAKKAITLEDLLTMTSGLECNESQSPDKPIMEASPNWVQFVLDQPMVAQPGKQFSYCTSAVQLVSAIIQNATGMSAREFANQNLFAPLGIEQISEDLWPSDPQGVTIGGYNLALTPRDMAKFGYLFLYKGQWDGQAVVPAEWVAASTTGHSNLEDVKGYGYLWWIDPQGKWYAALGLRGQHIFVYPAENLVVTFTSALPIGNNADLDPLMELLENYILPAVKSNKPLPANPDGQARLEAAVQTLTEPTKMTPQPLPEIAAKISGKIFNLADNPFDWQTISFSFQEGSDVAQVVVDGVQQRSIGMDNLYRTFRGPGSQFPEKLRGNWENQDTLMLDDLQLGQMGQITFRIRFSGDTIHIIQQDMNSGSQVELAGTLGSE